MGLGGFASPRGAAGAVGFGMQVAGSRIWVWDAGGGIWDTGGGMQDARIQDIGCEMQMVGYRVQDARRENIGCGIKDTTNRI